ncbi:acyltransferase family protein [Rhodoferax ferrireducens]|uniref:acyltransferase family protein n=1 Tax=Rhodoferax ferrireducens TaxID=192843 RepID=UPI000E0D373A|nr:acyltransferase family protein [Rhodoferax ferrireducens]
MTQHAKTAPGFRNDINGLRAWAVVAVILYHFGVPGISGGFIGVDVFFVISGLLMTGIVVGGLEREGRFSVWAFYMARARRILPALMVLCAVLMTLGWWLLLPLDYKMLGKHALAALSFLSNILFQREAGYFDAASHEKWLLHTWSLAVEWQFYMLLPLVLLGVWKWRPGRRPLVVVMTLALLGSLALSIVLTPRLPTPAFYLLPTRAWEMLAGGLVYLLAHRLVLTPRQRMALEFCGFGLVIAALVAFDASSAWPGWRALVPVLGAVLVLLAARSNTFWTGHRVAQWLGTRSYSLYLWHWPVVVATVYAEWQGEPLAMVGGLLLTLLLGHLSYIWVETPARQQLVKLRRGWGVAALVCGTAVVAAPGALAQWKQGIPGRFPSKLELISQEALNRNPRHKNCHPATGIASPSCMMGGNTRRAILLGDSHANAVVSSLAAAAPLSDDGVMEWSYTACPTLFGVLPAPHRMLAAESQCGRFLDWAKNELLTVPKEIPLVIVNRTSLYAMGHNMPGSKDLHRPLVYFTQPSDTASPAFLAEFSQRLTDSACQLAKQRQVYLVRPFPEMDVDVPHTARTLVFRGQREEVSISLAEYHQRHDVVWAAQDAARDQCGVKILDPLPYLCWDGRCHGSKDGRPLYFDDNHLSEFGNRLLVPMFAPVFEPRSTPASNL